jgi:hypothetical protein
MKYEILSHDNREYVANRVNQLLYEGWELYGELSVVPITSASADGTHRDYCTFTQAMIKKDDPRFSPA